MLGHSDGYLRLSTSDDEKLHIAKWRWTRGPWAGYYVWAQVPWGDLEHLGELIYRKVAKVTAGLAKPTPDTYHK